MKSRFVFSTKKLLQLIESDVPLKIFLFPKIYKISDTIRIRSNLELRGWPLAAIYLKKYSNCFMISNHPDPVEKFRLSNIMLFGGGNKNHIKPEGSRISWGHAIYLWKAKDIEITRVGLFGIAQTGIQLFECNNVAVSKVIGMGFGWSGLATSGTLRVGLRSVSVLFSGLAEKHSAIHFDGGTGVFLKRCRAIFSSGNGLMWDNKWSDLQDSSATFFAAACLRGVSFSAVKERSMRSVYTESLAVLCGTGVLLSNAEKCIVHSRSFLSRNCGTIIQGTSSKDNLVVADEKSLTTDNQGSGNFLYSRKGGRWNSI